MLSRFSFQILVLACLCVMPTVALWTKVARYAWNKYSKTNQGRTQSTGSVTAGTHKLCYNDHPELSGLLCYKRCRSGYAGAGPVCWARCPYRTTDIGAVCVKKTYGRGVGRPLSTCSTSYEKNGLLCYRNCKSGYYGVGPVCWQRCNSGYADDGALCRRNAHIYGRNVRNCPWHDKCGLCGGPWYNVCGRRRNCGGSCRSGYHNDGCTCRRNVHIYAKKTYGRGAGKPMGCRRSEQKNGALCYKHCNTGYKGVGPVCWASCSGLTTDTGTQCQKRSYGRGVGKAINCLSTPTCTKMKNGGCSTISSALGAIKVGKGKILQHAVCMDLYNRLAPWLKLIQTFSNCFNNREWSTVSLSYTAGAAIGLTAGGEVGVAVDVHSKEGICYVGWCWGFKADISLGAEINIGYWKSIDSIPGKSKAVAIGVDVPTTEVGVGATFVTSVDSKAYLGTLFSLGLGIGVNPIDYGTYRCDTPSSQVTKFTQP